MPDGLLRRVFYGGFNVITIHDKTHQGGYYHKTNSNQHPIHIIPPADEIACYDIKKYLNLRPRNAEANFFLRVNKDPKEIENGNCNNECNITSVFSRIKCISVSKDVPENFNTTENLNTKKSNAKETLQ
ncbi:unnamed protein product [Rhizophagus irregularis]|nr:unnamed protein product [Rhizophagus irregularis]